MPYAAGGAAFVLVLLVAGALVGDWGLRNGEMRALVTRIEASEAAMGALQGEIQSVLAEYQDAEALSVEDRAALDERLAQAAGAGRDAVAAAGAQVAALRWLSWHSEVGAAQDAYLAHNRAWQEYLSRAAEDPAEFAVEQTEVNDTFEAAEAPVRAAVPPLALFNLPARVDVIFAPPPDDTGGPTQQA